VQQAALRPKQVWTGDPGTQVPCGFHAGHEPAEERVDVLGVSLCSDTLAGQGNRRCFGQAKPLTRPLETTSVVSASRRCLWAKAVPQTDA
jgi:hypothetical protein